MSERRSARVLDALIEEARAAEPPELDWARMERSLERELRRPPSVPPARAPGGRWVAWVAAAALVAAGVGALVRSPSEPASAQEVAAAAGPSVASPQAVVDGDALAVGARLESGARPVTATHGARASWVLAPGGVAAVVESGRYLTIGLERGSVESVVARGGGDESFAVEVGGTRVAVRGTRFRVTLAGERVLVSVDEGVVVVGPAGARGATRGWELGPGTSGEFSLSGERLEAPRPAASAAIGLGAGRGARRPVAAEPLPAAPAEAALEEGVDRVLEIVQRCFEEHTPGGGGVRVSLRAQLALEVLPSGALAGVRLEPPLAPSAARCVEQRAAHVFPASRGGARASRAVELISEH
ncbi:MAG: FecR domain-containing protein [Polyangiaceae bacterium]|nr:FecR domain-containing protein [Polyangiaceae bacterium]